MANPHGAFIWYELLTSDADAAAPFYAAVLGWIAADSGQADMDYRIFSDSDEAIGGLMTIPPEGAAMGMKPGWLGYVGVDDVDASVEAILKAGGALHMPAMDIPNVGRIAMVADPQGAPFYVMRGAMDGESGAFSPDRIGRCSWNELATGDAEAAIAFYSQHFGWIETGSMPMGDQGAYYFIAHQGVPIGAIMSRGPETLPIPWRQYFRVADIDAAKAAVLSNGGTVHHGPGEVPGGDWVIQAFDPQGAFFGLVGKRAAGQ